MKTLNFSNNARFLPASLARVVVILTVLLQVPCPRAEQTHDEMAFQRHYQRSKSLYAEGKYEACIEEIHAAYKIRQLPRLLLNKGQALRKLGRAKEALAEYELYLQVEPNPQKEIHAEVLQNIAAVKALLAAAEQRAVTANKADPPKVHQASIEPKGTSVKPQVLSPPPSEKKPEGDKPYKKWWFWVAIGGAAAVGVAGGVLGGVLGYRSTQMIDPGVPTR